MIAGSSRGNGRASGVMSVGSAGIVDGATPAGAAGAFPGEVTGMVSCPLSTPMMMISITTTTAPPISAAVGGLSIRDAGCAQQRR